MTFAWWHVLIWLLPMLPTFWSIWHIWTHAFADYQTRMTWLVFVVFVPVIGGICYIISGRGKAHGRIYPGNRLRANERHIR